MDDFSKMALLVKTSWVAPEEASKRRNTLHA
jgi:hypothetical protein